MYLSATNTLAYYTKVKIKIAFAIILVLSGKLVCLSWNTSSLSKYLRSWPLVLLHSMDRLSLTYKYYTGINSLYSWKHSSLSFNNLRKVFIAQAFGQLSWKLWLWKLYHSPSIVFFFSKMRFFSKKKFFTNYVSGKIKHCRCSQFRLPVSVSGFIYLDIVQPYHYTSYMLRTFFPLSLQPAAKYAKVIIRAKFFSGYSNILCLPRSLPLEGRTIRLDTQALALPANI